MMLAACSDDEETKEESVFRTVYSGEIKTLNYLKTSKLMNLQLLQT